MTQVRLRPVESADVATVAAMLAHPDLVGRRGLDGDRDAERSVTALTASVDALVNPEDGDAWVVDADGVIGLATAGWWWDALTPWAHVVIDPANQRMGHGSSAARLVFDRLFLTTVAVLVEYSVPSWDADGLSFADSLGGERTGTRRRSGIRKGRYHDTVGFALRRQTWEGGRAAGR